MGYRILKEGSGVTLSEVTLSDGEREINRAYSVRVDRAPTKHRSFGDMVSAETYFAEQVLAALNPAAR
jgi:hypothetical protein